MLWRHFLPSRALPVRTLIYPQVNLRIAPNHTSRFLSSTAMPHSVHSTRENTPLGEEELALKYWNFNISPQNWTADCPQFLVGTSEKNKQVLSERDEDFKEFTWPEVKRLVGKQNPISEQSA